MKTSSIVGGLFLALFLSLQSCKEYGCTDIVAINYNSDANTNDNSCIYNTEFNIQINVMNGGQPFSKYDSIFFQNNTFRLENMKFYISNLTLNSSKKSTLLTDIHLFDIDETNSYLINSNVLEGNYNSISFGLGLNAIQNNTTPADYPTDHPLGINQNTFWAMTPASYIFVLIEGRMDTLQDSFYPLTYHLAHNDLLTNIVLPKEMSISKDLNNTVQIDVDISQLFNNVDLSEELPHQSTNSKLAQLLMNNFSSGFEIK